MIIVALQLIKENQIAQLDTLYDPSTYQFLAVERWDLRTKSAKTFEKLHDLASQGSKPPFFVDHANGNVPSYSKPRTCIVNLLDAAAQSPSNDTGYGLANTKRTFRENDITHNEQQQVHTSETIAPRRVLTQVSKTLIGNSLSLGSPRTGSFTKAHSTLNRSIATYQHTTCCLRAWPNSSNSPFINR